VNAIIVREKSYRELVRELAAWNRPWAVASALLGAVLFAAPALILFGAALGTYYAARDGDTGCVIAAAAIGTTGTIAAEWARRQRPWRALLLRRLRRYEYRAGDKAVQLRIAGADLPAAGRALRRAGYLVRGPLRKLRDEIGIEARHRPESPPAVAPEAVLDGAGITSRRTGTSTTIGPAL
jgi:hypothetical protein